MMTSSRLLGSSLQYDEEEGADTPRGGSLNEADIDEDDEVEEEEAAVLEEPLDTETLGGILSQLYNSHLPSSLKILSFLPVNMRVISSNPAW